MDIEEKIFKGIVGLMVFTAAVGVLLTLLSMIAVVYYLITI